MRGGLVSWRPRLAVAVALLMLAPPLLHSHPPEGGAACGDDGPKLVAAHPADGGPSHCPACTAGPPAAGLPAAAPAALPQPVSPVSPTAGDRLVGRFGPGAGSSRAPPSAA